jgi:hypothetical protein
MSLYALVQLVPAVTELVISELLWLNYAAPDKPIYVYINSTGGCGCGLVGCGLVVLVARRLPWHVPHAAVRGAFVVVCCAEAQAGCGYW